MSDFAVIITKKESGVTSFQSLSPIKKIYKGSKVGHCGTLDKFASGLMIVLTGEAAKLNPVFSGFDKSYRARIMLGCETDTLDPEGEVVRRCDHIPSIDEIEKILPSFTGEIEQIPPVYSAIHVGGKRAYELARSDREVEMKARKVRIHSLSVLSYEAPYLVIDCRVSKGTYIRSLARDIAAAAGSAGHLTALERYSIGPFGYGDITGNPSSAEETEERLKAVIDGVIDFADSGLFRLRNGYVQPGAVKYKRGSSSGYYLLYNKGRLLGVLCDKEGGGYSITAMVNREDI